MEAHGKNTVFLRAENLIKVAQNMRLKPTLLLLLTLLSANALAQTTGKFGKYYDQRELLFESLPASENDIIFLGNSITDGGEWSELFQNPNCKNRGISGDVVAGVLNRLETITRGHPAMVFLMIGTNDMSHGAGNDSIACGVRAIVQRIKAASPSTRIIVQSILPTNDCYGLFEGHTKRWRDVAVINGKLKAMAEAEDVAYLDLYSRFATEEGKMNPEYSNDGLHLNGKGYQLWSAAVADAIGPLPPFFRKSDVPIWLGLSMGGNLADCYDNGTQPYKYWGLGGNLGLGFTMEWRRCRIRNELRFLAHLLEGDGYSFDIDGKAEFLYRFHDGRRDRLHFLCGCLLYTI